MIVFVKIYREIGKRRMLDTSRVATVIISRKQQVGVLIIVGRMNHGVGRRIGRRIEREWRRRSRILKIHLLVNLLVLRVEEERVLLHELAHLIVEIGLGVF